VSPNTKLWLVALSAAVAGALLGAGAVWATQQATVASLNARIIRAEAEAQAAMRNAEDVTTELESLEATPSATEAENATTTPVPLVTKKKPAKTVKQFAFIKKIIESGSAPVIVADYAQMLTGDAAAAAAAANGDESPPPNDYYILNSNKLLRNLKVKPGISVNVATNSDGTSDPTGHLVTFANWAANFSAPTDQNEAVREAPYWIWVKGGTIVKIEQQYLP
jgi:DNA polymerase III delta prime subunit